MRAGALGESAAPPDAGSITGACAGDIGEGAGTGDFVSVFGSTGAGSSGGATSARMGFRRTRINKEEPADIKAILAAGS